MPEGPIIQEAGVGEIPSSRYCRRCHRKLRTNASMRRGFGPVCFEKECMETVAAQGEEVA